ncbi:MAG: hypothetical protein A2283_08860 [Lentisphaerae bacterium RIFOXYA12_FULL_48_11]|nr:MAG: hypothetical protein A2283_08860 [Lentisphaerae bacterium RIFOXYA12_FULL_48_11]
MRPEDIDITPRNSRKVVRKRGFYSRLNIFFDTCERKCRKCNRHAPNVPHNIARRLVSKLRYRPKIFNRADKQCLLRQIFFIIDSSAIWSGIEEGAVRNLKRDWRQAINKAVRLNK